MHACSPEREKFLLLLLLTCCSSCFCTFLSYWMRADWKALRALQAPRVEHTEPTQ